MMTLALLLPLAACVQPPEVAALADAEEEDSGDTAAPSVCSHPPDPDRRMGFSDLLARLEEQRCLAEPDILAVDAWMQESAAASTLFCDAIYRLSSPDGLSFTGTPERVVEHASVPDVVITDAGEHVVVYNDVTPGLFVHLLRTDPERLWRQGLLGYGGMGMSAAADGAAFAVVEDLDLHLDRLHEAVDPDLGRKPDGTWHVAWFGVLVEDRSGDDSCPLDSAMPHKYYRGSSTTLRDFDAPVLTVASSEGSTGGADPTILDLADGGEILFVGPLDHHALGWSSPDGLTWLPEARPDIDSLVPSATPDTIPDPAGGYRMHYMRNGDFGHFQMAKSEDGRTWDEGVTIMRTETGFNPSVARAPDGTWWLYYNQNDADCLSRRADAG